MFKIETGIPMPEKKVINSERTIFLMSLKVGDSFTCTRKEYDMIRSYQKIAKVKLSLSMVERVNEEHWDRSDDIVRVWRIE